MELRAWLKQSVQKLAQVSHSPESDVKWIFQSVAGLPFSPNIPLSLSDSQIVELKEKVERRLSGEPVAYILGEWEFYGIPIKVGAGVLVPRADTECLVERAIKDQKSKSDLHFADFGSGSGCIAMALLKNLDVARAAAVEKSSAAYPYLKANLQALDVASKVEAIAISTEDFSSHSENRQNFDFVVANPPYIARGDQEVADDVRTFEPEEALFSEDGGLAAVQSWLLCAEKILKPQGRYYFEIGWKQESEVSFLLESVKNLKLIEVVKDMSGHPRVVVCEKIKES